MSTVFFRAIAGGVLIVTLNGAAPAAQKIESGAGSVTAARKYLEGAWSLISYQVFPPGKSPIDVGTMGRLTFDAFGNIDAEIRVRPEAVEPLRIAGIPTAKGILSEKGRVAIDMQQQTLTYFFKGQPPLGAPSGPIALNKKRYWQVEDRVLTLTTKDSDGQPLSISKWQKAQ